MGVWGRTLFKRPSAFFSHLPVPGLGVFSSYKAHPCKDGEAWIQRIHQETIGLFFAPIGTTPGFPIYSVNIPLRRAQVQRKDLPVLLRVGWYETFRVLLWVLLLLWTANFMSVLYGRGVLRTSVSILLSPQPSPPQTRPSLRLRSLSRKPSGCKSLSEIASCDLCVSTNCPAGRVRMKRRVFLCRPLSSLCRPLVFSCRPLSSSFLKIKKKSF